MSKTKKKCMPKVIEDPQYMDTNFKDCYQRIQQGNYNYISPFHDVVYFLINKKSLYGNKFYYTNGLNITYDVVEKSYLPIIKKILRDHYDDKLISSLALICQHNFKMYNFLKNNNIRFETYFDKKWDKFSEKLSIMHPKGLEYFLTGKKLHKFLLDITMYCHGYYRNTSISKEEKTIALKNILLNDDFYNIYLTKYINKTNRKTRIGNLLVHVLNCIDEKDTVEIIKKIREMLPKEVYLNELIKLLDDIYINLKDLNVTQKIIGTMFDNDLFNQYVETNILLRDNLFIYKFMNWNATKKAFEFQTKKVKTNEKYFPNFSLDVLDLLLDPNYRKTFIEEEKTEITPEMVKIITEKDCYTENAEIIFKRSKILTTDHILIAIMGYSEKLLSECLDNKLQLTEIHLIKCLQKIENDKFIMCTPNYSFLWKVFDLALENINTLSSAINPYLNLITDSRKNKVFLKLANKQLAIKESLLTFNYNANVLSRDNTISLNSYGTIKSYINKIIDDAKLSEIKKEYIDLYEKNEFVGFPKERNQIAEELYFFIRSLKYCGNICLGYHYISTTSKKKWEKVKITISQKEKEAWLNGNYDQRLCFLFTHQYKYFNDLLNL